MAPDVGGGVVLAEVGAVLPESVVAGGVSNAAFVVGRDASVVVDGTIGLPVVGAFAAVPRLSSCCSCPMSACKFFCCSSILFCCSSKLFCSAWIFRRSSRTTPSSPCGVTFSVPVGGNCWTYAGLTNMDVSTSAADDLQIRRLTRMVCSLIGNWHRCPITRTLQPRRQLQ